MIDRSAGMGMLVLRSRRIRHLGSGRLSSIPGSVTAAPRTLRATQAGSK